MVKKCARFNIGLRRIATDDGSFLLQVLFTLAVISVVYMFYVVTVMEKAMTSMSKDMHYMTVSVNHMNTNMVQMTRDMNVMTRTTAPVMQGMRNAMPWAP